MTLDESIDLWQKEHEHEIVYACNIDSEVHEIVDRVNPWHTGTPTEEGWYLLALEYRGERRYDANEIHDIGFGMEWKYAYLGEVVAWQKIEENEDGRTD